VIGGGCASLAAAFELTRPEHAGRYEVTVYQQGWRLGGKGASGRGPRDRIEEHGLHLWMGWYENAFRLIRECYAELGRDPETCRIADWRDAFEPDPVVGAMESRPGGGWQFWKACFPPGEGLPGDPLPAGDRFTVAHYAKRSLELVRTVLQALAAREDPRGLATGPDAAPDARDAADATPQGVVDLMLRLSTYGQLATLAALIEAVRLLESVLRSLARYPENTVLRFLEAIASSAREQIEALAARDDEARRLWTILDLTLATMRGIVRFGLLAAPDGFDSIDDYDCREWLLLNGASPQTVHSGFMNGLYDLGFSYEDGDRSRPRLAAGQALRATIRAFFTYRGGFFWKMRSGMGDVVFAPLYEVLKRRGVRFEFFHRLENVRLADPATLGAGEKPYVEALDFEVQARVAAGPAGERGEYRPLIDVRGLPCWPAQPLDDQLAGGEALRGRDFESFWETGGEIRTLRVVEDFDFVVLGVGIGVVPHVCREIVARDPRWRAMVEHVKTNATQAFQLWMRTEMSELGWTDPAINVSGFAEPFETWADMRQLIPEESWNGEVRAIAYFVSPLPDLEAPPDRSSRDYPEKQRERVRSHAIRFLNEQIVHVWPKAARADGGFRWDVLVGPQDPPTGAPAGEARIDTQHLVASVSPSDRYTLSLPGSLVYRISPLDASYDNLTIAGDWTHCGFNAGCVEAAVMSGRLAAHALSQQPPLEDIVGFDHP
jgi:uncharacterized protein with NAD-binding domain and iron-sulfur cluster